MRFPTRRTAAIAFRGEMLLVVEGGADPAVDDAARGLGCGRVTQVAKLPMDRRHQSKIDYPALRKMLGG
jgi:hypothetical protein